MGVATHVSQTSTHDQGEGVRTDHVAWNMRDFGVLSRWRFPRYKPVGSFRLALE